MRTTVIIYKRGHGYFADVGSASGAMPVQGARCGLTPYDAAAWAARTLLRYAGDNPNGGEIMAPPEVLDLVPPHLREIDAGAA